MASGSTPSRRGLRPGGESLQLGEAGGRNPNSFLCFRRLQFSFDALRRFEGLRRSGIINGCLDRI